VHLPYFPLELPEDLLELQHGTVSAYGPYWDVVEETRTVLQLNLHSYIKTAFLMFFGEPADMVSKLFF